MKDKVKTGVFEVDVSPFHFSHGKLPKGKRTWVFYIGGETFRTTFCPYEQARKDAIKLAINRGVDKIAVLP